jgi:hypothetical protein
MAKYVSLSLILCFRSDGNDLTTNIGHFETFLEVKIDSIIHTRQNP